MTRRLIFLLAWLGVGVLFLQFADGGARRPAPETFVPPAEAPEQPADTVADADALPGESRRDPELRLQDSDPCARACSGTAFAIDQRGNWLTARHVVEGCRQIAILTGPRRWVRVKKVTSHPRADVSLLTAELDAPPLPIYAGPLVRGQDGFHLGYPRGEPGDVYGELLGRVKVRSRRSVEPGIMWAELDRRPFNDLPLGGLSGGPVVSEAGGVIGIAIAASPRRGRVTSAAPRSLDEVLEMARVAIDKVPAERLTEVRIAPSNYAAYGDDLRARLSVAKVLCWGGGQERRRRPPLR